MIIHVLPGDAQVEEFSKTGLEGQVVVCREALVDGNVRAENVDDLWNVREEFWVADRPEDRRDYRENVVAEFEKLRNLPAGTKVNLWFEYELFCHVNMWFCLWLLRESPAEIYRVAPTVLAEDKIWDGFGRMDADDLGRCFLQRVKFTPADVELGSELWIAFQNRNYSRLRELSLTELQCLPYLREACEAEIEKDFRPKQVLKEIRRSGIEDFGETFAAFREQAGVYGFGDHQVKRLLNEI